MNVNHIWNCWNCWKLWELWNWNIQYLELSFLVKTIFFLLFLSFLIFFFYDINNKKKSIFTFLILLFFILILHSCFNVTPLSKHIFYVWERKKKVSSALFSHKLYLAFMRCREECFKFSETISTLCKPSKKKKKKKWTMKKIKNEK